MTKQLKGQLSIYDPEERRRPCEYPFKREIGQRVKFWRSGRLATIVDIQPYFTIAIDENGEVWAGTPYEITPADED